MTSKEAMEKLKENLKTMLIKWNARCWILLIKIYKY